MVFHHFFATTLCNEGVQILKRKVSELFENGQKKCLISKTLDILWERRASLPYFKIKVRSPKK
jgi:hypothetical protein